MKWPELNFCGRSLRVITVSDGDGHDGGGGDGGLLKYVVGRKNWCGRVDEVVMMVTVMRERVLVVRML